MGETTTIKMKETRLLIVPSFIGRGIAVKEATAIYRRRKVRLWGQPCQWLLPPEQCNPMVDEYVVIFSY